MQASVPGFNRDGAPRPPDDLSRLVRAVNAEGVSFQDMADRAARDGYEVSKPYFQKMAAGSTLTAPSRDRLPGIAAGLRRPLPVVQRAAAAQFFDYRTTELSGYDEDARVILAHLAGMDKREIRRWRRMIEAADQAETDED